MSASRRVGISLPGGGADGAWLESATRDRMQVISYFRATSRRGAGDDILRIIRPCEVAQAAALVFRLQQLSLVAKCSGAGKAFHSAHGFFFKRMFRVHLSCTEIGGVFLTTTQSSGAPAGAQGNSTQFPERFVFHGNAVAAGTVIRSIRQKPFDRLIPVQGQSSLPTIGGHSESFVQGSDASLAEFFSYGEVRTRADGILDPGGALTTLSTSVQNVRVVNRPSPGEAEDLRPIEFKAERLALEMRSTYPRKGPPRIEFITRPQFQGITLDNLPVEIKLRQEFLDLTTMAELDERFRRDEKFFAEFHNAFMYADPRKPPKFGDAIPTMNEYAVTSIVESIRWNNYDYGHVITRVGFGTIFFGEMLINQYNRRVTLVRIKAGSDMQMEVSLAEGDPNGTWIPPE
jgi:hypothetical protein